MSSMQELVQQVQALEAATTDLLEATNVSKQTLDSSVDAAQGSAEAAANAEAIATPACNDAVTAKNESVKAKEEALAIVHNAEGSLTSSPGKYPVADNDGHLDVNWTPLLAAMYPYSGVIGSVDKGDVIRFLNSQSSHANSVWIWRNNRFNINGKFVDIGTDDLLISLAEAESTAARATAFDDIFIDWHGNVVTHRSITPHRTTTGYDRDLIATEHGYTKVQAGLYRTDDAATYLLLLGRIARRNQGAYHPVYNPEGSRMFQTTSEANAWSRWFTTDLEPTSLEDCMSSAFYAYNQNGNGALPRVNTPTERPDGAMYDAIYATDFTPLYYSAKNIIDRQALLFDSFNRAVAGETFSGAEGTTVIDQIVDQADYRNSWISTDPDTVTVNADSVVFDNASASGDLANVTNSSGYLSGEVISVSINITSITSGQVVVDTFDGKSTYPGTILTANAVGVYTGSLVIPAGTLVKHIRLNCNEDGTTVTVENISVTVKQRLPSARPEFLATDIIGAQSAMPAEWLTEGIPGNWLAVDEDGESLIPDGTEKNYKLSRKCLECYLVLFSNDNGATWRDDTTSRASEFEDASNSWETNLFTQDLFMVLYRTRANPFELTTNPAPLLAIKNNIEYTNANTNNRGCLLTSNLISKVPTGGSVPTATALTKHVLQASRGLSNSDANKPENLEIPISLLPPACKFISNLGQGYLYIIYKEIILTGDDNKFNIVDNQSTANRPERRSRHRRPEAGRTSLSFRWVAAMTDLSLFQTTDESGATVDVVRPETKSNADVIQCINHHHGSNDIEVDKFIEKHLLGLQWDWYELYKEYFDKMRKSKPVE